MAAAPFDDRSRMNLKPMWSPHFDLGILSSPPSKPSAVRGHIYSPSPRSPKTLPTPVLPSLSHDGVMRQHERSLVDRLDQRVRQSREGTDVSPAASAANSRPISPVDNDQVTQKKLPPLSIPSTRGLLPQPPTPASPATNFPNRRPTIFHETRSMLLAGLGEGTERRQSVPYNRAQSQAGPIRIREATHLEQLRAWGPVYLGDTKSADIFVQAVSLRRPSDMSSSCSEASNSAASSPQFQTKKLMVRARVRPRDIERKTFLIERTFDLDELRATIPDPLPAGYVPPSPAAARAPAFHARRGSMFSQHAARRSSSVQPAFPPGHRHGSIADARAVLRGTKAMPMHIEYARASVPVLAALIVSGHVREGDIIDLPLPHPEAWPATVSYIYTGRDELTNAVRENITYLAGKIPLA